jgi:Tfp pilus assembly protein PilV
MNRARRGISLIETMMAVVVLAAAAPPMLAAIASVQRSRADAVRISTARWLAAERMEDILADRHSASRGFSWVTGAQYPAESPVASFAQFARSVSIVNPVINGSPDAGVKLVTVTVTFTKWNGTPQTVVLTTLLANHAT